MSETSNGVREDAAVGLRPPLISTKKAAAVYARLTGRKVRLETVRRWCRLGVSLPQGGRLVLASTRLPRERVTTEQAVEDFARRWSAATGQQE